ncbi:MAG: GGDEF domain-containing protein [Roseateles depolymerans]|uniref:diguanylate cyclase n=1 Tax=Roseateles depolymerans TaxID=76731 RepID=A0A2W5DJ01_9BURK|nr:MAG: GGDEF domain-containing protein [Roseateles depolymerans]
MSSFDPRALNFTSGLLTLLMGVVMLGQGRSYPKTIQGVYLWGLAPVLWMVSVASYYLTGSIPEPVVVLVGNGCLMAGYALLLFGSQRFYGKTVRWGPWLALDLACLAVLGWFLVAQPDYRVRVAAFTSCMAIVILVHAHLLLREGRGFAARFVFGVLVLQALVVIVRGALTFWVDQPDGNRFQPSTLQSIYFAAYSLGGMSIAVGVLLMASERLRAEFEHLASHDGLTGALTRRALLVAGEDAFRRWQRYGRPMSLLLIDLDDFKQVNDKHGHLVGDRVLVDFVHAVRGALRGVDLLGRYGGEEFVVLMPETDGAAASIAAERIRSAVETRTGQGDAPGCTVSVGVTAAAPGDARIDELLARADAALYRAKDGGRNRVVIG